MRPGKAPGRPLSDVRWGTRTSNSRLWLTIKNIDTILYTDTHQVEFAETKCDKPLRRPSLGGEVTRSKRRARLPTTTLARDRPNTLRSGSEPRRFSRERETRGAVVVDRSQSARPHARPPSLSAPIVTRRGRRSVAGRRSLVTAMRTVDDAFFRVPHVPSRWPRARGLCLSARPRSMAHTHKPERPRALQVQLLAVDHSAPTSMKSGASSVTQCELQDTSIIGISNAHCGLGLAPRPRPSEGRHSQTTARRRDRRVVRAPWAVRARPPIDTRRCSAMASKPDAPLLFGGAAVERGSPPRPARAPPLARRGGASGRAPASIR